MQNRIHVLLSVIFLLIFFTFTLNMLYGIRHGDLSAIYQAADHFSKGNYTLIFGPPAAGDISQPSGILISSLDFQDSVFGKYRSAELPYVYPPLWAALLAPVTRIMDVQSFSNIILIIQLSLLTLSLYLCFQLSPARKPRFPVWILLVLLAGVFTLPLFLALLHNQPQITIFALTILAFWQYSKGRTVLAGTVLGIAAAIKLLPLFFIVIFIADRKWRALMAFLISSSSLAVLSFVLTGVQLHLDFLHELSNLKNTVVLSSLNFNLEVPLYIGASVLDLAPPLPDHLPGLFTVAKPDWMKFAPPLLMVSGLVLILWAPTLHRGVGRQERLLRMMIAITLWSGFFAPVSWAHYYLMPLFLSPAFPTLIRHGGWATAGCLVFPAFSLLNMTIHPIESLHWVHGTLVSTTYYLILFFWVVLMPQNGRTTAPE